MHEKVLVADDEPDVVELIGFNLRTHGYEVISAKDGLEALLKARRFLPDLVVGCDDGRHERVVRVPDSAGATLHQSNSSHSRHRSNWRNREAEQLAAGAVDFMTKPFSPRKIGRILESCARRADQNGNREARA